VAKAVLEIVIQDSGPPPVGAPAPAGGGFAGPAAGAAAVPAAPGTVGETIAAVAQVSGHGGFASVVLASTAALEKLTSAADKNRDAQDAQARARIALPAPSSSAGSLLQPPPLPGSAQEFVQVPEGAGGAGAAEAVGETAGISAAAGSAAAGLAIFTAGAVVAGAAAVKLGQVFEEQARGLGQFSPELAIANAQADFNQTLAEIRRAQRIGPDLAEFESERSRIQVALYDVGTELLSVLLQFFRAIEPLVDIVADGLEVVKTVLHSIADTMKDIIDWVKGDHGGAKQQLLDGFHKLFGMAQKAIDAVEKNNPDFMLNPFKTEFENAKRNIRRALPKGTLLPQGF
jgi:hypothetical protein